MANIINNLAKWSIDKISSTRFSFIDEIFNVSNDNLIPRWVLLLPGNGCEWAKEQGGCYMCGFRFKIEQVKKRNSVSHDFLMTIYRLGHLAVSGSSPQNLTIYNGGSFLNNAEIPQKTQTKICHLVNKHPTLQKLFIESRPEFVTQDKISHLNSVLNGKTLEVGIGLECESDLVRTRCIHKGFNRSDFEKAVNVIRKNEAEVLTYVFLKPIYLTERESIEEAIETIKYAFKVGSTEVALEAGFVQEGTRMAELYHQGKYSPPWLWSIIKVVEATYNVGPVSIGGFEDEPQPIKIPYNCPKCSALITGIFEKYKRTRDTRIFDGLDCECKSKWEQELR